MGRVAKLLSFVRTVRFGANVSDVKINPGGGDNVTAEHFAPPGDDSFPLITDYPVTADVDGSGREAVIGYNDPINTPKSAAGEKRIYARDAATGVVIVEMWFKNDGTGTMFNANGSFTLDPAGSIKGLNSNGVFELKADGNFVVNGVIIDPTGNITTPTGSTITAPKMLVDGKELKDHTHPAGTPPGDTGPNN